MRSRWLLSSSMLCALLFGTAAEAQTRRHHRHRHRGAADAAAPRREADAGPRRAATPATPSTAPSTPRPPQPEDPPLFYAAPGYVPANPYRAGGSEGRHFGSVAENDILATMRTAPVRGNLRNYGNTSVNIRVDFPGPSTESCKPSEQRHEEHWRARSRRSGWTSSSGSSACRRGVRQVLGRPADR
ncbi:MAG: hypothetical protein U0326_32900 [Polyangiales bacterium]